MSFKISDVNLCEADKDLCRGNKGIHRIQMPVIEDTLDEFRLLLSKGKLDIYRIPYIGEAKPSYLNSGVGDRVISKECEIDVRSLKPTQNQLWLGKAIEMALDGEALKEPLIVSKDNYVIDGHHRWAALLLLSIYRKRHLYKMLPYALGDNNTKVEDLLSENKGGVGVFANCIQFDLNQGRLLAIMNAYTDAKGIERKH